MSRIVLTLDTLKEFRNGIINKAFQRELEGAIADIKDRPEIKTAREVHLIMLLEPGEFERGGVVETVQNKFRIKTKIPARETLAFEMEIMGGKGDKVRFNSESPEDSRQATLDDEADRRAKEKSDDGS